MRHRVSVTVLSMGPFHRPKHNPTDQITDPTQPIGAKPSYNDNQRLAIYFSSDKEVNKPVGQSTHGQLWSVISTKQRVQAMAQDSDKNV